MSNHTEIGVSISSRLDGTVVRDGSLAADKVSATEGSAANSSSNTQAGIAPPV